MDLVASIQAVLDEAMLRRSVHWRRNGDEKSLPGGGVALNCMANGKILRTEGSSASGPAGPPDAGGALGAALRRTIYIESTRKKPGCHDSMKARTSVLVLATRNW